MGHKQWRTLMHLHHKAPSSDRIKCELLIGLSGCLRPDGLQQMKGYMSHKEKGW